MFFEFILLKSMGGRTSETTTSYRALCTVLVTVSATPSQKGRRCNRESSVPTPYLKHKVSFRLYWPNYKSG